MEVSIRLLILVIMGIAFLGTVITVPLSIKLAYKTGALDVPDGKRRIHERIVPRIGGIGIFFGASLGIIIPIIFNVYSGQLNQTGLEILLLDHGDMAFSDKDKQLIGILIAGTVVFLFGLLDDYKDLPPWAKLGGQIGAATIAYYFGVKIEFFNIFIDVDINMSAVFSYILTVLWIVAITNTINLLDGLDGLAAGTVAIAALFIGYTAYIFGYFQGAFPMMAIAGATIGFLLYNFYPAKTFMGDCGSQYLGFLIGTLAITGTVKSATLFAVIMPGIALSLPILDTVFAIIRRKIQGKSIMAADKGHFHHRLIKTGMGQRRTVLCMYGITAMMGIASVLYSRGLYIEMVGLIITAAVYVVVVLTDISGKKIDKLLGHDK